ncbi:hypothetical protein BaRGS_00009952 [Batillaria attramentaria]|uniref:Uncharacterized protein n=1 Tax=Batillaria attramentaria TaxID=370345 RepID=A0ABD0LHD1_9CAEN
MRHSVVASYRLIGTLRRGLLYTEQLAPSCSTGSSAIQIAGAILRAQRHEWTAGATWTSRHTVKICVGVFPADAAPSVSGFICRFVSEALTTGGWEDRQERGTIDLSLAEPDVKRGDVDRSAVSAEDSLKRSVLSVHTLASVPRVVFGQ